MFVIDFGRVESYLIGPLHSLCEVLCDDFCLNCRDMTELDLIESVV